MLTSLFVPDASPSAQIDIDTLIHRIRQLLCEQKAPLMIGGPADYKPLLFVSPYVYQQKLWDYETRFAERLPNAQPTE